jgi:hypothetical protein
VLDLRLYRVTLLPFAVAALIVAFSLHPVPAALPNTPAAQTFDGVFAAHETRSLAAQYPDRAPGSADDTALAGALASTPSPYGLDDRHAFRVRTVSSTIETLDGERTVETVIATSPGTGTGGGIAVIADRGGAPATSPAGLSATATLLGLATIVRNLVNDRPLTLVSTSGGASVMSAVAAALPTGTQAAIVVGDVGARGGMAVVPWSGAGGLAPLQLRQLLVSGLPGPVADVPLVDQLARLALPVTSGPQGPLLTAGIPAVFISAGGEAQPAPDEPAAGAARLGAFGQALLGVTLVLDGAPSLPRAATRDVVVGTQVLGGAGVRIVVGALLLSLLGCTLDVFARARRRGVVVGRWIGWTLSLSAPFLLGGLFVAFLGLGGLLPATPAAPTTAAQLPIGGSAVAALVSVGLLFALAWVLRAAALARGRRRHGGTEPIGAAVALAITSAAVATLAWLANPYTAALIIVPAHLWLVVLTREPPAPRSVRAGFLIVSLLPVTVAIGLLCAGLHTEPLGLTWTVVLMVAGGALSPGGLVLGSVVAGCFLAATRILLISRAPLPGERLEVTVRGPLSYAGPGSLGGTDSALHRPTSLLP